MHMRAVIPHSRGGWSIEEEKEIERLRAVSHFYPQIEVDCGSIDEHDPWCIVYLKQRQRIILHIARIDGWYVMAWPTQSLCHRTRWLASAVDLAEKGLPWAIGVQLKGIR